MPTLRYWDISSNQYLPCAVGPQGPQGPQGPPGTTGPATGPAGGDLGGTYPNPIVDLNIPTPLGAAAPFTTFTDSLGTVWVAKGGVNGGVYKQARDVMHCSLYRTGAMNVGTTQTVVPMDAIVSDAYGLYNMATGQFTNPIGGWWQLTLTITVGTGGVGYVNARIVAGIVWIAQTQSSMGSYNASTAFVTTANLYNPNTSFTTAAICSQALPIFTGGGWTNFQAHYMGTG